MRSRWLTALAAAVVALPLLFAPTASAAGVVLTRFYAYGTDNPKMCLDGYIEKGAYVNKCNDGDFQKWYWNNTPGIRTPIQNLEVERCLQPGADIDLRSCQETNGQQRWFVNYPPAGGPVFIKHLSSGWCLERYGSPHVSVKLARCETGNVAQRWVPIS